MLVAPGARADEGMWPFDMIPRDRVLKEHGVTLTDAWLDHLRLASVRFNSGGSGSFVSPTGLVLTNHHVAADCIGKVASSRTDFMAAGFRAGDDGPELRCPDLELNVTVAIQDVTDEVRAAKTAGMSDADANLAMKGAMSTIEKRCADATGKRCDVVSLYAGGKYALTTYEKYTDVRLVFAPERAIAFFGGDAENFTYPRFDYDLAIFRVYGKDGAPIKPTSYLRWNEAGPKEGDTVFVSGHPGSTGRLETTAELLSDRDAVIPFRLALLRDYGAALTAYGGEGAEEKREAGPELFHTRNSEKALTGFENGLKDPALMRKKGAEEEALRGKNRGRSGAEGGLRRRVLQRRRRAEESARALPPLRAARLGRRGALSAVAAAQESRGSWFACRRSSRCRTRSGSGTTATRTSSRSSSIFCPGPPCMAGSRRRSCGSGSSTWSGRSGRRTLWSRASSRGGRRRARRRRSWRTRSCSTCTRGRRSSTEEPTRWPATTIR